MRPAGDEGGYGSVAAMAAIVLVSGFIAAWAGPYAMRVERERRALDLAEAKRELEESAAALLADMESSTGGDTEKMLAYPLPRNATLRDESARLNLNWARPFLLRNSPLASLVKDGRCDEFAALRSELPLGIEIGVYEGLIESVGLERYFCLDSPMDLNTVDEYSFERAMALATDDASAGPGWRERLGRLRLERKLIRDEAELRGWFGEDWDRVSLFASWAPELNANSLDPFLLGCLVSCPDFHIQRGAAKAAAIVEARSARYLGIEDLRTFLGVGPENPIWAYLGSSSLAWRLRVRGESGLLLEICFQARSETESGSVFRVMERRWSHE